MPKPINELQYVKPFVRWAGGKSSIKNLLLSQLPNDFDRHDSITYVEPFVGSGAMLFNILVSCRNINKVIINDINKDLIHCYKLIKENPQALIQLLEPIEQKYYSLDLDAQKEYYYTIRSSYNSNKLDNNQKAAYFIFLNHTCFNGLYRENANGGFNVPFGKNKKPRICNKQVLLADHKILSGVEIFCGDYKQIIEHISKEYSFFYIDPPYRPLYGSDNFKKYSKSEFGDPEQEELKAFCDDLNKQGHQFMLSNSDSKDENGQSYFESLYQDYSVDRILAPRFINAHVKRRNKQVEVLITNYTKKKELLPDLQK